jgi:two-component system, OmpR family, response regulator MprA
LTRVLIVEDDPWIQWMIADDLADRGYEIMTARDGVEALERIGVARPDVIVLDLMLPRLDGWKLTRTYQTATNGEVIPIVVVSAARSSELLHPSDGVRRVLAKPFDMEELARTVAQLSPTKSARAPMASG